MFYGGYRAMLPGEDPRRPRDEQCPKRGPAMKHTLDLDKRPDGRCGECGMLLIIPMSPAAIEVAPPPSPQKYLPRSTRIPSRFWARYTQARDAGLSDEEAQALIACVEVGLDAVPNCRPWTLAEAAKLEFVAWFALQDDEQDVQVGSDI